MTRGELKGSFTVEASILMPFIMFLMVNVLQIGISFYQESVNRNVYEKLENMNAVATFYQLQILQQIGEEVSEDGS